MLDSAGDFGVLWRKLRPVMVCVQRSKIQVVCQSGNDATPIDRYKDRTHSTGHLVPYRPAQKRLAERCATRPSRLSPWVRGVRGGVR